VRLDGERPWDIRLLQPGVPERVLAGGSLALGEAYMDGAWSCERLDELFTRLIRARLGERARPVHGLACAARQAAEPAEPAPGLAGGARALRPGQRLLRGHAGRAHDLHLRLLARRRRAAAATLDQAQEAKLDLVCRKLGLQPGMRVLDIGCGWGSFMGFAAERYGVRCVGITISEQQAELGRQRLAHLPVEFRLQDYREWTSASTASSAWACSSMWATRTTPTTWPWPDAAWPTMACSCCTPSAATTRPTAPTPGSTAMSFPMASCPASPAWAGRWSRTSWWRTCTTSAPTTTAR
jgi:hypothetical protein